MDLFDSDIIYLNQITFLSETKPYYFEKYIWHNFVKF
jgi:hypothetical protein